jgi:hypothetical protein
VDDACCGWAAASWALTIPSAGTSGVVASPPVFVVVGGVPGGVEVGPVVVGVRARVVVGDPGVVVVGVPGMVVVGVPGTVAVVVVGVPGTVVVVGVPGTVVVVVVGVPGMVVVTTVVVVLGGAMLAVTSTASMYRLPVTPEPDPRNHTTVLDPLCPEMSNVAVNAF